MAEVLYFKDGTTECCFDDKEIFFERILEEKLGSDAAHFFKTLMFDVREEATHYEESYKEQERIADGYLDGLRNIGEILKHIEAKLKNPKRLTRTELLKAISEGITELNNYI